MKPARFDYARATTMAEALRLAADHSPDARFLAGGQSLIAMLNMRLATPKLLIDIGAISEADYIRTSGDHVAIGCATRQADLERWPGLNDSLPLLARALPWIGHVQTRSRGTVCGSIAHADPSSELPLCLALLDGEVELRTHRRTRTVAGRSFFQGVLETARQSDELISEIRLPRTPPGTGTAFNEMAIRHGDFAIIAVGAIARADTISIAIGGGANRPEVRDWSLLDGAALDDALNDLAWSLDCQDDLHATAAYRRNLVRTLGRQTVEEALACRS